jgi:membrane associated rhomboid family serine protease
VTVFLFRFVTAVPAIVAIGMWAALQFFYGVGQVAETQQTGGIAYAAHIGGFVAGVVIGLVARALLPGPERRAPPPAGFGPA